MKSLIIFTLFVLSVIAIITIVMCVRDLFKILLYRNKIHLIIKTLVESPLPTAIINIILPDSLNRIPDERIQILNYVFHGTANKNFWHKRTNKKNIKRAFQFFKTSSQGLLSNEYFIKSMHRLLGSEIFEFTNQNIICKKEFWTSLYLTGDEYIYWPKFFFEDREFILSIYASCTQYENRNLPLFIYLSNSLKRDKVFVKNLLREKTSFYNYEIISDNIPNNLKTASFFKEIIDEIDSEILKYAPKDLKLDEDFELIKSLYTKNKDTILLASPIIKADKKNMIELSKIDNSCLKYLDKSILLDIDFYRECLQNEIRILQYVPKETPDYEKLALEALNKSESEVRYLPKELLTSNNFILEVLKIKPILLPAFYEKLQTEFFDYSFIFMFGSSLLTTQNNFQLAILNAIKKIECENFNFWNFLSRCSQKDFRLVRGLHFKSTHQLLVEKIQNQYNLLIESNNKLSSVESLTHQKKLLKSTKDFLKSSFPNQKHDLLIYFIHRLMISNIKTNNTLGNL